MILHYFFGYIYKDNEFIPNYKTYVLDDTCSVCLTEDKREFIITTCGHKICLYCF